MPCRRLSIRRVTKANVPPAFDKREGREMQHGFTLVELLVVVAIIAILVSLVFPVLLRAKASGKKTSDIARMRQLGQASALYANDSSVAFGATGCPVLVELGLVQAVMCGADSDIFPKGTANFIDSKLPADVYGSLVTAYKNSFVGLREMSLDHESPERLPYSDNSGWLVMLQELDQTTPWQPALNSTYHRLQYDGAVTNRRVTTRKSTYNGKPSQTWDVASLFGDNK